MLDDNAKRIGENLKRILKEKKISAKDLAERVGVSSTHLSYVINGKRKPSFELLDSIAFVLNISLTDLVSKTSSPVVTETESTTDDEIDEILESLHKRPEMKTLFSVTKNATKEDIEKAVKIIEALKDK